MGFDLTVWMDTFVEHGLGTEEVLLTMAGWEGGELNSALSEIFPIMTTIQRIALRKALLQLAD